jgi:hypothetical protein
MKSDGRPLEPAGPCPCVWDASDPRAIECHIVSVTVAQSNTDSNGRTGVTASSFSGSQKISSGNKLELSWTVKLYPANAEI